MLKVAYSDNYCHPLPDGHRFPMEKYRLLPKQLLHEGTLDKDNFFQPEILDENIILSVHSMDYYLKLKNTQLSKKEQRKTGFPLSTELFEREVMISHGTVKGAEYAIANGVAMNIAGGTHHAFFDRGEGFCLLNDQAIAAKYLLDTRKANRILIIDLDVHQGNGTAAIFQNESRVFTFSMHGENNYPLRKETSDLDVGLEDGIRDKDYHYLLDKNMANAFELSSPDFIFYQSGVDVLLTDKLGRLGLSIDACKERDKKVLQLAKDNNIPIFCSMGGGYSKEIRHIIESHANTFRLAQDLFF